MAELLAQKPEQNVTNTGRVRIRDAAGKEREIPARFEIFCTPTNWVSVYETLASPDGPGGARLTVIHTGERPNQYELLDPARAGGTNAVAKELTPDQTMVPFRRLGFLGGGPGPGVSALAAPAGAASTRCGTANPARCWRVSTRSPVPGGYARVVSWIMIESPHGIVHADAYDAKGERLRSSIRRALRRCRATINWRRWRCGDPQDRLADLD